MSKSAKKRRQVAADFYDKCHRHARRRGYAAEICEDFPSWAFVRKAEGASGTIAQLFVDYLRITLGAKSSPNRDQRQAIRFASSHSDLLDQLEDPRGRRATDQRQDSLEIWRHQTNGRERAVVGLFYWYGLSRPEIAELFGITPTRVGQILRQALAKMQAEEGIPSDGHKA
jgi:DNA-directed RNA polymerase specialized sigma subunit